MRYWVNEIPFDVCIRFVKEQLYVIIITINVAKIMSSNFIILIITEKYNGIFWEYTPLKSCLRDIISDMLLAKPVPSP